MVIVGRIFEIHHLNDKSSQIVLKKKMGDKIVLVAIEVFGYWKDKALNEQGLKPKDKIKGNVYMKSRLYNNRYYTDVFFKDIIKVEEYAPSKITPGAKPAAQDAEPDLFAQGRYIVDVQTGEIIEQKNDEK